MAGGVYNAAVLADSPVVYWKLSDTATSAMLDSSGNGRHGVYKGSPTFGTAGLLAEDTSLTETSTTFTSQAVGTYGITSARSPIAYYKMTEPSGTFMLDSSGNGYHGRYSSNYALAKPGLAPEDAAKSETSVQFSGATGLEFAYADSGHSGTFLNGMNTISVDVFIKPTSYVSGASLIAARAQLTPGTQPTYWALLLLSGGIQWIIYSGNSVVGVSVTSAGAIPLNTTHRITATSGDGAARIYVDGVQVAQGSFAGVMNPASNSQPLAVGAGQNAFSPLIFNGYMEKLAIFREVLTPEQVASRSYISDPSDSTFQSWVNMPVISVEAIIKVDTVGSGYQIICERDSNGPRGSAGRIWNLLVSDGYPTFSLQTTLTDFINVQAPTKVTAGSIYHVVGTYDGSAGKLYINGALVASKPLAGQLLMPYTQNITVGNGDLQNIPLNGAAEKIAIYDRALTAEQIATHYAAMTPTSSTPTMASAVGSTTGGVSNGSSFFIGPR